MFFLFYMFSCFRCFSLSVEQSLSYCPFSKSCQDFCLWYSLDITESWIWVLTSIKVSLMPPAPPKKEQHQNQPNNNLSQNWKNPKPQRNNQETTVLESCSKPQEGLYQEGLRKVKNYSFKETFIYLFQGIYIQAVV